MDELKLLAWFTGFSLVAIAVGIILVLLAIFIEEQLSKTETYKKVKRWLFEEES